MTSVDTELALVALAAMLSPTTLFLSVLALVVGVLCAPACGSISARSV
jgi:hypothetical protein